MPQLRGLLTILLGLAVCIAAAEPRSDHPSFDSAPFDTLVPQLVKQHQVAGVGIAVIRGGEQIWTGFYGEQAPGVAANKNTVFNTASVAKTVTAETLIALAQRNLIDLDEPIADYVQHRDLSKDPRYQQLTARLLLSHRGGLLNWPYEYDNNRLAFDHDPNTRFSYSGAGIQLAAEYAEAKLKQDFEALAFEHVLTPLGIEDLSMGRWHSWMRQRVAQPMTDKGRYARPVSPRIFSNPWQAADDLFVTVNAYATFLFGVMAEGWLDKDWTAQRSHLLTNLAGDRIWACEPQMAITCPKSYGHGLGWQVYRYADHTVLTHSGNDDGENAVVYYSPESRHGAVILVNGANGWFVSTRIIELIGDEPEVAAYYRALIEKHYGIEFPALAEAS